MYKSIRLEIWLQYSHCQSIDLPMSRVVLPCLVHCDRPHSPQNIVIYDLLHTAAMSNMQANKWVTICTFHAII